MRSNERIPADSPGRQKPSSRGRFGRLLATGVGVVCLSISTAASAGVHSDKLNDPVAGNVAVTGSDSSADPISLDLIHSASFENSYATASMENTDALLALQPSSTTLSGTPAAADGLKIEAAKSSTPPLLIPVPTAFSSGLVGLVMLGIGGGIYRARRRGLLRG
ncbi:MAG TPA: hypothetical protein VFC78_22340 [Tepidisphaeraceae bacterium]|nr:hypothetical protein [Tepidisphaeraceae bacterium]